MSYFEKYLKYKAKYLMTELYQEGGRKYKRKRVIIEDHSINVQNPWFDKIKSGKKTVEGRLNKGTFAEFKIGDIIKINNDNHNFKVKIINIDNYESFSDMIIHKGLDNVLPGIKTLEEGVAVYRQFYLEDKEKEFKVLAITVKLI